MVTTLFHFNGFSPNMLYFFYFILFFLRRLYLVTPTFIIEPIKIDNPNVSPLMTMFGLFGFGWGIGIRTPTNRVRVCRATVTQFPKILQQDYYTLFFPVVKIFFIFLRFFKVLNSYSLLKSSRTKPSLRSRAQLIFHSLVKIKILLFLKS